MTSAATPTVTHDTPLDALELDEVLAIAVAETPAAEATVDKAEETVVDAAGRRLSWYAVSFPISLRNHAVTVSFAVFTAR